MEYHIRNNLEYHSKDRMYVCKGETTKPRGLSIKLEIDMVAYSVNSNNCWYTYRICTPYFNENINSTTVWPWTYNLTQAFLLHLQNMMISDWRPRLHLSLNSIILRVPYKIQLCKTKQNKKLYKTSFKIFVFQAEYNAERKSFIFRAYKKVYYWLLVYDFHLILVHKIRIEKTFLILFLQNFRRKIKSPKQIK